MRWWSYHRGQLFSKQNQPWPSMLDSSIIPETHQKLAFIKWHYLHERQLPNKLSPIPPFNLQSRACRKGWEERKDTFMKKRREIFISAAEANIPPACSCPLFPLLKVRLLYFLPLLWYSWGLFRNCMWKLVTKQHIRTFSPHEGSFKFDIPEG